jgi:hypothetical protein
VTREDFRSHLLGLISILTTCRDGGPGPQTRRQAVNNIPQILHALLSMSGICMTHPRDCQRRGRHSRGLVIHCRRNITRQFTRHRGLQCRPDFLNRTGRRGLPIRLGYMLYMNQRLPRSCRAVLSVILALGVVGWRYVGYGSSYLDENKVR